MFFEVNRKQVLPVFQSFFDLFSPGLFSFFRSIIYSFILFFLHERSLAISNNNQCILTFKIVRPNMFYFTRVLQGIITLYSKIETEAITMSSLDDL